MNTEGVFIPGRPSKCDNPASGVWEVTFKQGRAIKSEHIALCAECAFVKMPKRVRMVETSDGEVIFFKDVLGVELIHSYTTDFDQNSQTLPISWYKHWVEGTPRLKEYDGIQEYTLRELRSRKGGTTKMDMQAYRRSLREHDDGK